MSQTISVNGEGLGSDVIINLNDTVPEPSEGHVNGKFKFEGGGVRSVSVEVEVAEIEEVLSHAHVLDLDWENSGHSASSQSFAAFNTLGNPIVLGVEDTASAIKSYINHDDLNNLAWESCGHISGEIVPTIAAFDEEGEAHLKTIESLTGEMSHADLADLDWTISGHYTSSPDGIQVAAFGPSGDAQLYSFEDITAFIAEEISHDALSNLEWTTCGHKGTPGSIPAFTLIDGYATEISAQEIVDTAVINHAVLDNLAWVTCGHTGTPNTIAIFDAEGNAICGDPIDLVDFTDIEAAIDEVAVAAAAAVAAVFFPAFKVPVVADSGIDWMEIGDNSSGSQALISGSITYSAHYQEGPNETFDGLGITISTAAAAGNTVSLAIYDVDANGKPNNLLWYCAPIATTSSGLKNATFASGTWTTAGASYKDGADQLVLTRGQTIYKAMFASSSLNYRVITDCRSLGRPMLASGKPYTGFKENGTYPTFPGTATPVVISTQIPVCPLHRA